MMNTSEIEARVASEAARRGWAPGTLCQHAGVGFQYFERLQAGAVSLRTLRRLSDWLDRHAGDDAPVNEDNARVTGLQPQVGE